MYLSVYTISLIACMFINLLTPMYIQDVVASGALKFKPQIVVIAGAFEQGLLTDKFPMYYTVSSKRELHDIIDGPPTIVGVEEPFDTLPVSLDL